jgi:hypothetical protein
MQTKRQCIAYRLLCTMYECNTFVFDEMEYSAVLFVHARDNFFSCMQYCVLLSLYVYEYSLSQDIHIQRVVRCDTFIAVCKQESALPPPLLCLCPWFAAHYCVT